MKILRQIMNNGMAIEMSGSDLQDIEILPHKAAELLASKLADKLWPLIENDTELQEEVKRMTINRTTAILASTIEEKFDEVFMKEKL